MKEAKIFVINYTDCYLLIDPERWYSSIRTKANIICLNATAVHWLRKSKKREWVENTIRSTKIIILELLTVEISWNDYSSVSQSTMNYDYTESRVIIAMRKYEEIHKSW